MGIRKQSSKWNGSIAYEELEISYWSTYYGLAPCSTKVGGATVFALPSVDILAMNRVIGLGLKEKVTKKHLQEIIGFYESLGIKRFFVQLPPYVLDVELRLMLKAQGFRHLNNWVKLVGPPQLEVQAPMTDLTVTQVGKEQAQGYAQTLFDSFDWTDERLVDWLSQVVGKDGYRHYLAWHRDKPVAAAALYQQADCAAMAFAGTLPGHRGNGAQSLLIHTRMKQAFMDGCRWVMAETAEEKPGQTVMSFRNLVKKGLKPMYARQNWIYEF